MTAYVKTKDGLLQKVSYRIPDKVQGVAFDEEGRVYISASYGRMKSSYLKVYASLEEMDGRPGRSVTKVWRLLDFGRRPRDIADPWYTGNFDVTYEDIVEGCEAFLGYVFPAG